MAQRIIGIDIGSDNLKLAVCVGGVVKKAAVARFPEDLIMEGKVTSVPALVEFLKSTMKSNHIAPGPCAMVIPSQMVISHRFTTPPVSDSELRMNLPFEFKDFVGKDEDDYLFDYSITNATEHELSVYACAVRKSLMDEYFTTFKKAGLTLKIATPVEMAWLNLIQRNPNLPEKLCIVDIGHSSTRVSIFANGNFVMGKNIDKGGALIDETIVSTHNMDRYEARARKETNTDNILAESVCQESYQDLTVEIMKVLNFYAYSDTEEGGALKHLYYCGGSSRIAPLMATMFKGTEIEQYHISQLLNMGDVDADMALQCALAAGAANQTA